MSTTFKPNLSILAIVSMACIVGLLPSCSTQSPSRNLRGDDDAQSTAGPQRLPADGDADGDYLSNGEEEALGTDPNNPDSDGDGYTDFVEARGSGTDPNDPNDRLRDGDLFVELPYQGDRQMRTIKLTPTIEAADVNLLIDTTSSMFGARRNLIRGLVDVVIPGIQAQIPDVYMSVSGYADYPVGGYGTADRDHSDLPYFLLRKSAPIDEDLGAWSLAAGASECPFDRPNDHLGAITGAPNGRPDVLDATEGLPCSGGNDIPESVVPALWSTATGKGLSWSGGRRPDADCPAHHKGMPCFRPHALPVIVASGNTQFHNGPGGVHSYGGSVPDAPTFDQTTQALRAIGARVIGIDPQGGVTVQQQYDTLARDTLTTDASGEPLTFTIGLDGSGIDQTIVDAITKLATSLPFDVTAQLENVPGNPDEFDATQFIKSMTPEKYEKVVSGTELEFELELQNDVRPHADEPQFFKAKVQLLGDGFVDLGSRIIYILVPPSEGDSVLF